MNQSFKPRLSTLSLSLLVASAFAASSAQAIEFLPAQAGDFSSKNIIAAPTENTLFAKQAEVDADFVKRQREPVAVSWAVQNEKPTSLTTMNTSSTSAPLRNAGYISQSRESYRRIRGAELNAGLALHTSAPGALLRLQAIGDVGQREKEAIHPKFLEIKTKDGRKFINGEGMQGIVTADKMAKADLPFASGTSSFRLDPNLGSGEMQLQANGLDEQQEYLLNVVEPASPYVLNLGAEAGQYLQGQDLVVHANLASPGKQHGMQKIDAQLVSPNGHVYPLQFKVQKGNAYRAQIKLDTQVAPSPGLWEVRMQSEAQVNGQKLLRTARNGIAVAFPVASLNGQAKLQEGKAGLAIDVGVDAASSGRYEVRGTLYGMREGKMSPLAMAHSANWVEAGQGAISLNFDQSLLQNASAPFEVRDLSLHDQTRIAILQKHQRGLLIEANDLRKAGLDFQAGLQKASADGSQVFAAPKMKK